jgi:hypothetical protein
LTLAVIVSHRRTPISTQQIRLAKGVEQLYYVLLFTGDPSYDRDEIWRDWLAMGFHVAIKSPPPGTARADRLKLDVRSAAKAPEIYASSDNAGSLRRLQALLEQIERLRASLAGAAVPEKTQAILDDAAIEEQLAGPLRDSLERHGMGAGEFDRYTAMLLRGLLALTDDDVVSIRLAQVEGR